MSNLVIDPKAFKLFKNKLLNRHSALTCCGQRYREQVVYLQLVQHRLLLMSYLTGFCFCKNQEYDLKFCFFKAILEN